MKDYDPNDAIDFIFKTAPEYAVAKGTLAHLEVFKNSLKAIEMTKSKSTAINAKEMDAYASNEYQELCKAIGMATEEVEALRWKLEAAKMRFEAWRTESATNRNIERMTR